MADPLPVEGGAPGARRGSVVRRSKAGLDSRASKSAVSFRESKDGAGDALDPNNISEEEKKRLYRKGFSQLGIFFLFLIVFTVMVLASQSREQTQFASHIRRKFTQAPNRGAVSLDATRSIQDFWAYTQHTFVPAVWPEGGDIAMATAMTDMLIPIDMYNRIVGSIRMWQVRVELYKDKAGCETCCAVGTMFSEFQTGCYQPLNEFSQDKESFGPQEEYGYLEESNGGMHQGKLGTYPSKGHAVKLPTEKDAARAALHTLDTKKFIDAATRAIFIDFTVWNSNTNLHAVVRLTLEISGAGILTSDSRVIVIQPRHLRPMSGMGSMADIIVLVAELAVCLFLVVYIAEEFTEFTISPYKYFFDPWNVLDWINLILLMVWIGIRMSIVMDALGFEIGKAELNDASFYRPMQSLAERVVAARTINAYNSILIWGKCLKYIGYMPYIKTLVLTLEECWQPFLSFLFMFILAFLAFSSAYTIGFGESISDMSSMMSSAIYLCRSFLGDVDLTPIYEQAPLFGAVLILFFSLSIYFLMMNVFFAIIALALDGARDSKVQDFRQEMLVETIKAIKNSLWKMFSPEHRIRKIAPGLWAKMYKATRQKRKMAEKKRLLEEKKSKERLMALGQGDGEPLSPASSGNSWAKRGGGDEAKRDVLKAVEHMAGKLLSKVQGISFEMTAEMRDAQSAVDSLKNAGDDLERRLNSLSQEQLDLLENDAIR